MNANAITITARTSNADRRIAASKVNGHVALVSRLKRKWHSLRAWFAGGSGLFESGRTSAMQSTFDRLRPATSGRVLAVAVCPRPVVAPGRVDLRRTRLSLPATS